MLQFIVCRSTVEVRGKKANTKIGRRKTMAAMLIAIPKRPRDQRRWGRGSFRKRFNKMHPIERMYADINDVIVRETIALRAT